MMSDRGTTAVAQTVDLARKAAVVVGDQTFKDGNAICQSVDLLLHLADDGLIFARTAGYHLRALVLSILDQPDDSDDHREGRRDCNNAFHLQPRSFQRHRRTPVDAKVAVGWATAGGDVKGEAILAAPEHNCHLSSVEMHSTKPGSGCQGGKPGHEQRCGACYPCLERADVKFASHAVPLLCLGLCIGSSSGAAAAWGGFVSRRAV
jgi:hypothetical protein